jgi:hypothetical protein
MKWFRGMCSKITTINASRHNRRTSFSTLIAPGMYPVFCQGTLPAMA